MAGSLFLLWWLATGLHLQEGALDVPLEPLTFFTGSSASFAIPVFVHLEGWRPLYSNLIRDYSARN